MLELRPNCQCCHKELPPDSAEAMICTLECTFCRDCAEQRLHGICPNCGGNLTPRPIRPERLLAKYPASTERVYQPDNCYDDDLSLYCFSPMNTTWRRRWAWPGS